MTYVALCVVSHWFVTVKGLKMWCVVRVSLSKALFQSGVAIMRVINLSSTKMCFISILIVIGRFYTASETLVGD